MNNNLMNLINELQQYTLILNEYNIKLKNKKQENNTEINKEININNNILNGGVENKNNLSEFNLNLNNNDNINSLDFI